MGDWRRDLSDSAYEFRRLVWPAIRAHCGGGDIETLELAPDNSFNRQLDMLAGIDAWQFVSGTGIRGIASRVQWDDDRPGFPYRTFTVRKERYSSTGTDTEYKKRSSNDDGGWVSPYFTVHAYCSQPRQKGRLCAVAVARTADVIAMIREGKSRPGKTKNAEFLIVEWADMQRSRHPVWIWPERQPYSDVLPSLCDIPTAADVEWLTRNG